MKISFDDFKKNPVLYILFLPLVGFSFTLMLIKNIYVQDLTEKNIAISKAESKRDKQDSIINKLYMLLGEKKIIDSLKTKP